MVSGFLLLAESILFVVWNHSAAFDAVSVLQHIAQLQAIFVEAHQFHPLR